MPAEPASSQPVRDDDFTLHRPSDNDADARLGPPAGSNPGPRIRMEPLQVTGRLPAEVIQRIVRQHGHRFLRCYKTGLAKNAALQGRVAFKFTIDASGTAVDVADSGSTLADPDVVSCIVAIVPGTTFPQPESGTVQVLFPMTFTPPEP